jgi:hypothetical protein
MNILNKVLWAADKGWSSKVVVGPRANNWYVRNVLHMTSDFGELCETT